MKPFLCSCDKTLKINSLVFKNENLFPTLELAKNVPSSLTSILFDVNSPCSAILTIHLPTSQIIVVNSTACELLNYTANELCCMKLENIIHESYRQKFASLQQDFLKEPNEVVLNKIKLLEFINREGEGLPVFFHLKRIDSSQRCLAVAEPLGLKTGTVTVDENGKILSCDDDFALIFEYEASELIGVKINNLLPAVSFLKKWHRGPLIKQKITGRTRYGDVFPVSLTASSNPSSEVFKIYIQTYGDLSGLIFLSSKLFISHFTKYIVKLLLGYSKKEIINQHVFNIIPKFCHNGRVEHKGVQRLNGVINTTSELNFDICDIDNSREFDSEFSLKTLYEHNIGGKRQCDRADFTHPEGEKSSIVFNEKFQVKEGKFSGSAKHKDNSLIDIKYQVRTIGLSDEFYYCIWLCKEDHGDQDISYKKTNSNATLVSSINSISLDELLDKDSNSSDQFARPSTASIISQADESLTAGDYSLYYTNIKQIGKGAFGYVKMAFRNSDGLLVVTKFIKKKKIHIRSWVYHSGLNMKIPLEISFLTTLQHPNIVKVMDVFHNDSFVQLVMEKHGAGFDLFEFIDRGPNCDEKLKSYIFRQIISAVYYLNSLGILHRDIKEENVIINEKFEVKLIDFGSATFIPQNESFSIFYGTVEYCSPEVLQGNTYKGPELEIWALGVTLYVLTFGKNPFFKFEEIIQGQFSIPSPISEELNDLLHQMLDKNIHTRITIEKVVENVWINQPVNIENYRFEEVVRCSDEEAFPPKYIHEIRSDDFYFKIDSLADSDQQLETNKTSNSSLQNITMDELEDIDENFQELHKAVNLEVFSEKKSASFSSTRLQKSENRLCKSFTGIRKHYDDSLSSFGNNHRHRHSNSIGREAVSQESIFSGFDINSCDTLDNYSREHCVTHCTNNEMRYKKFLPTENNYGIEDLSDISTESFGDDDEDEGDDDDDENEDEDDDDDVEDDDNESEEIAVTED